MEDEFLHQLYCKESLNETDDPATSYRDLVPYAELVISDSDELWYDINNYRRNIEQEVPSSPYLVDASYHGYSLFQMFVQENSGSVDDSCKLRETVDKTCNINAVESKAESTDAETLQDRNHSNQNLRFQSQFADNINDFQDEYGPYERVDIQNTPQLKPQEVPEFTDLSDSESPERCIHLNLPSPSSNAECPLNPAPSSQCPVTNIQTSANVSNIHVVDINNNVLQAQTSSPTVPSSSTSNVSPSASSRSSPDCSQSSYIEDDYVVYSSDSQEWESDSEQEQRYLNSCHMMDHVVPDPYIEE